MLLNQENIRCSRCLSVGCWKVRHEVDWGLHRSRSAIQILICLRLEQTGCTQKFHFGDIQSWYLQGSEDAVDR